jgi:two-component system sensor histidine kinase HydH
VTALTEIRAAAGLDVASQSVLAELAALIAPEREQIIDSVARAIQPVVVVVGNRSEPLRRAVTSWLDAALRGPHDDDALARRHAVLVTGTGDSAVMVIDTVRRGLRRVLAGALREPASFLRASDAVDRLMDAELGICRRHERLDADARLARREREYQARATAAMQRLTAGLAHEIRNPLNAAKLQLELLERRLKRSTAEIRILEASGLVHHEIERLASVLNAFLDFAQPPQLSAADHDLVAVVTGAIESEQVDADRDNVVVELRAGERPVVVRVDAAKMHQVVRHLVRNAIAAVGRGGHVEVDVATAGDGARIVVRDNGPGIADDVLPRIWEPFFSTRDGATGMGMPIVHTLVEQHGGTVTVRTSPAGTELEVTLLRTPELGSRLG